MKKFFIALTLLLTLALDNLAEATEITQEQIDKILSDVKKNETTSKIPVDVETFLERFDWFIVPIVQDGLDRDDVSELEPLFVIFNYASMDTENGRIFYNLFGYRGAMFVCMSSGDDEHDLMRGVSLYYTTPENQQGAAFTSWILTAFVGSISTEVDVQTLMSELTAEGSSGNVVNAGFKFSLTEDGNLNILTVSAPQ